jgi:hypothetical protein
MEHLKTLKGMLLALPTIIIPGRKLLAVTNILAYNTAVTSLLCRIINLAERVTVQGPVY